MKWEPLHKEKLAEIEIIFKRTYPAEEYGNLAERIGAYWLEMLKRVWVEKSERVKQLDLGYDPADPLSRVEQKTVVITYADSIYKKGEKCLETLDRFLKEYFPALRGMHMLPACSVAEGRFNDGYFSQVKRNKIHEAFGSNEFFESLMRGYFSMADFVLNHVDIENPVFQAYLDGDDEAGEAFFVFSEEEYQTRLADGDFTQVFRPRPFPLFSIYRRKPKQEPYRSMPIELRFDEMKRRVEGKTSVSVPLSVCRILYLFNKIQNDQMLLDEDYRFVIDFRKYLEDKRIDPNTLFTRSQTQEVQHVPYIFKETIKLKADLLENSGFPPEHATIISAAFDAYEQELFGEEIRALTTFSHVQVDLNTSTCRGLTMLADDFAWYLSMDMNMLRLDAANFAFKRWKTSCFGLPEIKNLMKILYLSMEAVSPRIVANLEVNDSLTSVLTQMADKESPPPMMYDFHLASLLPAVFLRKDPEILGRIFKKIDEFDVPETSIRFSLAESHDGKSVRGSMDLLTITERQALADTVEQNGGKIKYKSVPLRQYPVNELTAFCRETGIDEKKLRQTLFEDDPVEGYWILEKQLLEEENVLTVMPELGADPENEKAVKFFLAKMFKGREPYELCVSTRDSLERISGSQTGTVGAADLEARRYLAFHTLAFALMGRNVKSIYFNDLLALPNDDERYKQSGELRDIKRTKSDYDKIERILKDPASFESEVARGINNLIALVDSDPALHFRGSEAEVLMPSVPSEAAVQEKPVALVHNRCGEAHSLAVINLSPMQIDVSVPLRRAGMEEGYDNISKTKLPLPSGGELHTVLGPFERLWITAAAIEINKPRYDYMHTEAVIDEIKQFLSSLPGVIETTRFDKKDIPVVLEAETANEGTQLVKLVNIGIREVVRREHIFLFLKDKRFRPPPCSTIYLVEEPEETTEPAAESVTCGGKRYPIIGEEVIDKNKTYEEEHMFFQEGFVMFPKRRRNRHNVPSHFLIPPVPFPELEEKKDYFSIKNIMSVSPSTTCDDFLRQQYNFSKEPKYATILVGFDGLV
jgi:hypothetical protein